MELVEGEPLSRIIDQRVPLTDPERFPDRAAVRRPALRASAQHHSPRHQAGELDRPRGSRRNPADADAEDPRLRHRKVRRLRSDATGHMMFTPNYVSPEQIKGGEVDRRSDMFAVGAVAYELLVLKKAFVITSTDHFTILDEIRRKIAEEPHRPMTAVRPESTRSWQRSSTARWQSIPTIASKIWRKCGGTFTRSSNGSRRPKGPSRQRSCSVRNSRPRSSSRAKPSKRTTRPWRSRPPAGAASGHAEAGRRFLEQELEEAQERQTAKRAERRAGEEPAADAVVSKRRRRSSAAT